jgi:hypothetical protein
MRAMSPPYPSIADARRERGDEGVRALAAWALSQPTYGAAARALGTDASTLGRACKRAGAPLPPRKAGAPRKIRAETPTGKAF